MQFTGCTVVVELTSVHSAFCPGVSFSAVPIGYIMGLQRAGPLVASIYEGPMVPVCTMAVVMVSGAKPVPSTASAWLREIVPLLVRPVLYVTFQLLRLC